MDPDNLRDKPRSERVKKLFGHPEWGDRPTIPEYQAKLLDYGAEKARAQTAPKKGRQVGATMVAGMLGADHAVASGPSGTDVLFAAPSQGTANEMFRECKKFFWNSDFTLDQFGVTDDNKETWEFVDGTRILSRTLGNVEQTDNSGNRGMSPTCVIVDEADYTKDATYTEEIRPFFITHDAYEFHLFSTPAKTGGYFHDKVESQGIRDHDDAFEAGDAWYSPYWPTEISPFAKQHEIDRAKDELTDDEFAQEYLGEFRSGGGLVSSDTLGPCIQPERDTGTNHGRYLGVDPAGGGQDRLVIYDIDEPGVTHNIWAWGESSGPEFLNYLTSIVQGEPPEPEIGTGRTPDRYQTVVIEKNAIGEYGADFAERDLGDVILPLSSSLESKHTLYKRLVRDLEGGDLALPNHTRLKTQLTALRKTVTPTGYWKVSHPKGGHDDYPDALMLANGARHGLAQEFRTSLKQSATVTRRSGVRARKTSTL